jgi:tetratricopeptide (TPR) repeat protein
MARQGWKAAIGLLLLLPGGAADGKPCIIYSPEEIRRELSHRLSPEEVAALKIPWEADEGIRRLAGKITRGAGSDHQKLSFLLSHFRHQGYLDSYDKSWTRTAREVAEDGKGNCLSYANLFVAMARSVGLQAFYLDASRVTSESGRSGRVLVDYGHVLVGVRIGPDLRAIDFDGQASEVHRFDVISDLQAIADYYNNLGFELSWSERDQGGFASEPVIRMFELATRIWPEFARAWNNLGVALGRAGRLDEASEAYRRAIEADVTLAAPHVNLGQIHYHRGDLDRAIGLFQKAVELNPENAHYRLFLGKALAERGRFEEALRELERGAGIDADFFLIHMQLAEIHRTTGNCEQAERSARRVLEIVPKHLGALRLMEDLHQNCG